MGEFKSSTRKKVKNEFDCLMQVDSNIGDLDIRKMYIGKFLLRWR